VKLNFKIYYAQTYGGTKVTFVCFYLSRAHEILCRGHELLSRGHEITKSWVSRGHELLCRGHEINKSLEQVTMSWPRESLVVAKRKLRTR
jgi:hypothetical protein